MILHIPVSLAGGSRLLGGIFCKTVRGAAGRFLHWPQPTIPTSWHLICLNLDTALSTGRPRKMEFENVDRVGNRNGWLWSLTVLMNYVRYRGGGRPRGMVK